MGKYSYVASARRRARRLGAHGGGEGRGILCRHAHSLLILNEVICEARNLTIIAIQDLTALYLVKIKYFVVILKFRSFLPIKYLFTRTRPNSQAHDIHDRIGLYVSIEDCIMSCLTRSHLSASCIRCIKNPNIRCL